MTKSPRFIQTLFTAFTLSLVGSLLVVFSTSAADSRTTKQPSDNFAVLDGTLVLDFDPSALADLDFRIIAQGHDEAASTDNSFVFPVTPESILRWHVDSDGVPVITSAELAACGALLLDRPGDRAVITNPTLRVDPSGVMTISTTLDDTGTEQPIFDLTSIWIEAPRRARTLRIVAELSLSRPAAERWFDPDAAGKTLGSVTLVAELASSDRASPLDAACQAAASDRTALEPSGERSAPAVASTAAVGPDVLVADLQSVGRFARLGDITAYGIGTTACNIGTERASWISYTNQHPVIIQNLFRLKQDRFEQIGMAWVKHGFYAVSQSVCSTCLDPTDGSQLGVGCSDPYSASLNAVQTNMSPRSLVNADTGYFPYPWSGSVQNTIVRRLQVHDADLAPTLNPSARYFIEGHYVTPGDCTAGTDENNSSYREVTVTEGLSNVFNLIFISGRPTQRGQPAARAWKDIDPAVVETDVHVPDEGLFILAAKASSTGNGIYRYSYALQNLNSDRSARSFSVLLPVGAVISGSGFHDAEYHSGEPYDNVDWNVAVTSDAIMWSTDQYAANPNANALRYATVFTFWFDVNVAPVVAPETSKITIGLFKPGAPSEVVANTIGPKPELIDCNLNGVADVCDLDCGAIGCPPPPNCGGSLDCAINVNGEGNGVPDECEIDCQPNGFPDACDIFSGRSNDCQLPNGNGVPDECEPDCDGDGIPDTCETITDTDGDGVEDCVDLCPFTTPVNACLPPYNQLVICCFPSGIYTTMLTWSMCITSGGTPVCDEPPVCPGTPCRQSSCRDGCLIGDCDGDGDLDGNDFAIFLAEFGSRVGDPKYDWAADIDEDGTVTLVDYQLWLQAYRGFVGNSSASAPQPGVLGDLDADGDVDLGDFADLQSCVNGAPEKSLLCIVKFDFDGNQRVDLDDFAAFQVVFRGPQR